MLTPTIIKYWSFVYHIFDMVAALEIVLRTSGVCGKVLAVIDLFMERALINLGQLIFYHSVSVFVGAALGGFPYVKDIFLTGLVIVQLALDDFRIELDGGDEVPADGPFHEE